MELNAITRRIPVEYDACGLYARIDKSGRPTREMVDVGLEALHAMKHRAGSVQGEGDGCGLMLDIPKRLWQRWLFEAGEDPAITNHDCFFAAHLFVDMSHAADVDRELTSLFEKAGCTEIHIREGAVDESALGTMAQSERPAFVQAAGLTRDHTREALLELCVLLEQVPYIHVASLDRSTVVYKAVGDAVTLHQYYADLQQPVCESCFVMAHTRFSTNTKTAFARVQPFRTLCHNGEINTIVRFYEEAGMLSIPMDAGGSDSQMVASVVEHFVHKFGFGLYETVEFMFPPIVHEIKHMPKHQSDMYMHLRAMWGPFAQGPAAVMLRAGNEAVFGVDALGLRPLWFVETEDAWHFSSEQSLVPVEEWIANPKPFAPGEKMGLTWNEHGIPRLHHYDELRELVWERMYSRYPIAGESKTIRAPGPYSVLVTAQPENDAKSWRIRAHAHGWREDDFKLMDTYVQTAAEPIRSLGFDEPLAALGKGVRTVSDFIQETVAVVTNPAIDREREIEHFSTRVVLGRRPSVRETGFKGARIELPSPLLLESHLSVNDIEPDHIRTIAHRHATVCFEDALSALQTTPYGTVELLIHRQSGESISACLTRLQREAVEAVQAGAGLIVLNDRLQFRRGMYVDPFLATAAVHKGLLRPATSRGGEYLRRRTSVVLCSAGLRNLHDIMVALGLGADAVNPRLLWEVCGQKASVQGVENAYKALCKGIEKVISTLGIHELRGYERLFSAIGLHDDIASILGITTFCVSDQAGYGFADMEGDATERQARYELQDESAIGRQRTFPLYPRIWKSAGLVAMGQLEYSTFAEKLQALEDEMPINLRHTLRLKKRHRVRSVDIPVDTSIDRHTYPFIISSMSFGSQGETAFRAYAEAAYRLNIVAMNGEGGEIKDLLHAYPINRGRQIASGRFGVNAQLCNGAYVLEIKIGQGAKPGEGGHLPGSKVTEQVANARNAAPGIDLISPSNNHDIYSIEDLAQVIHELRTINPEAKIAVKVPVVPNIGTIAVGIAKAGADIVELSGFDGGTGAARAHAIRHVGLPADLGIKWVHDALCAAGLRNYVEIWADGGMKSGMDVIKAILLGANRVGFGTMAMVAIGCTACRACHKDTCHVGIATQMTSVEEAYTRGLKQFVPQEFDLAVERLVAFFAAVGEHVRQLTYELGANRTQDLVGRSDLLEQFHKHRDMDLSCLTTVYSGFEGVGTRIEFRTWSDDVVETAADSIAVGGTEIAVGGAEVPMPHGTSHLPRWSNANGSGDEEPYFSHRIYKAPRVLGTSEAGERVRNRKAVDGAKDIVHLHPVGNGFAAYHVTGLHQVVFGGAQDGVGKGAYGGRVIVLKHRGASGRYLGGSVGKGLAYGAQRGLFIVQGNADARAGIRLSGADIVIGGEITAPLQDDLGCIGCRANLAGFAFEYMTAGRAVVLGDPGPWICSGMTGGSVYVRLNPEMGFTEMALRNRIAKGANVVIRALDGEGEADVTGLLTAYYKELRKSGQRDTARDLLPLLMYPREYFVMIRPGKETIDQTIATE